MAQTSVMAIDVRRLDILPEEKTDIKPVAPGLMSVLFCHVCTDGNTWSDIKLRQRRLRLKSSPSNQTGNTKKRHDSYYAIT